MHDKRRLSDEMLRIIRAWSKQLTLEEEMEDGLPEALDVEEAYIRGIRDGKAELSRDILEAQDLINYNWTNKRNEIHIRNK